jgi:NTE family protein
MAPTAVVLGGGGLTGIGWELGMLAGLAAAGADLSTADLIVGTSAGSVVGAQLASGANLEELYEAQLAAGTGAEIPARMSHLTVARMMLAGLTSRNPRRFRSRVGAMALGAATVPEKRRRQVIEARLRTHAWPERRLLLTAVDAHTGEAAVFDRNSGVPLVDAVTASCAVPGVWPPVTIDGHRYIDGGVLSIANADLAAGCDRIVVLAPMLSDFGPGARLSDQVAKLRVKATVVVLSPGRPARQAIGRNVLDPARRAPAAQAGRAQAGSVADQVASAWSA